MSHQEEKHVHISPVKRNTLVLVLFIPAAVFSLVLAISASNSTQNKAAVADIETQNQPVLGSRAEREIEVSNTTIRVKLAKTDKQHAKGLSGRQGLAQNEGMLFIFPENYRPRFWMKDMQFAIDIIWINDGKISQIDQNLLPPEPNTPEEDLSLFLPNDPVDYVLEVAAGTANANLWQIGDPVQNLP